MSQITTLVVNRSYAPGARSFYQLLSATASAEQEADWIKVEEVSPGLFIVIEDSMTEGEDTIHDPCALGLCSWDEEVVDLDAGDSDEAQCFDMSTILRWNDVVLTPEEFRAPSIERLKEALEHVTLCAWCPGDI